MQPELTALARYLAELYRDQGTVIRLVEQAGLESSRLPLGRGSPADWWFAVVELAESEERLETLVQNVRSERPGNKEIGQLWDAYLASVDDTPPKEWIPPTQWDTYDMEQQQRDWRVDGRVDALQRDVAALGATVARLEVQVAALVEQNKAIIAQLEVHWKRSEWSPSWETVGAVLFGLLLVAVLIFAGVYVGGGRP